MYRTQIQLTEAQAHALKELAASQQRSMAEVVREAVDMLLETSVSVSREERQRRALAAVGRFHSGHNDIIATEHDRYLDEAYADGAPGAAPPPYSLCLTQTTIAIPTPVSSGET